MSIDVHEVPDTVHLRGTCHDMRERRHPAMLVVLSGVIDPAVRSRATAMGGAVFLRIDQTVDSMLVGRSRQGEGVPRIFSKPV